MAKSSELLIHVAAEWDADASVWVATSDDVPGLVAEHSDFMRLQEMVLELVPLLLAENGLLPSTKTEVPVHIAAHALSKARARVAA